MCDVSPLPGEIDRWIEASRADLLTCASRIVQTPSESRPPTGDELECQTLVRALLDQSGAQTDWFTPDDVPGLREHPAFFPTVVGMERQFAERPVVVGHFPGAGGGRSILFSTHVDTVVAGDEPWQVAGPFSGAIIAGKLYGRGAYDTKAALASYIYAVRCLTALGVRLRGDISIESTCDEEWGGSHGVLAARLRGHTADVAINTEPTALVVCPEHRGGRDLYLMMRGDTGMNFAGEQAVNAIGTLARTVLALEEFERERNAHTPTPALYRDNPGLPVYMDQVRGGGTTYFEAMGPPAEVALHVWAETYAGTTAEGFDRELMGAITRRLEADPTFHGAMPELRPTIRYLPGSAMALDHPIFGALEEAYRTLPGRDYVVRGAPLACDAYIFNLYSSTPALVLGPGGGNAHAADEYVLVEDLIDLARLTARLLIAWCGVVR